MEECPTAFCCKEIQKTAYYSYTGFIVDHNDVFDDNPDESICDNYDDDGRREQVAIPVQVSSLFEAPVHWSLTNTTLTN